MVTFSFGSSDAEAPEEGDALPEAGWLALADDEADEVDEAFPALFEDPLPQAASRPERSATPDSTAKALFGWLIRLVPLIFGLERGKGPGTLRLHFIGKRIHRKRHILLMPVPFFLDARTAANPSF